MSQKLSTLLFLTALFTFTSCIDDDFENINHSGNYINKTVSTLSIEKDSIKWGYPKTNSSIEKDSTKWGYPKTNSSIEKDSTKWGYPKTNSSIEKDSTKWGYPKANSS
ncbi:hypothetical protein, partial [Faecalibacter rhinopitheci]